MKKIKLGQIGIGHNHGGEKMLAARKFPELFEITGYAEENERWVEKRGDKPCYEGIPRMSVEEILEKSIKGGVKGVWNFAPVDLRSNDKIEVQNVHLSDSLLTLSFRMNEKEYWKNQR